MSNKLDSVRQQFSQKLQERLIALRRDLHRHPELSFEEHRTSQKLYEALARLQPKELSKVAGTGVMAQIKGKDPKAPVVAIRGDIDALPIQEATGLAFASQTAGVMHACGHDVHASWAVGAACLLSENPAPGDVRILLQPAEEVGRGARVMLEAGVLDGVTAIFGAHVDRRFSVGQVVAQEGPLAASSDTFEIVLRGQGAHGARPHEAVDPVVGAAAVITALQTIVSRRLNPAHAGVVTVGSVHAGSAPNIIPAQAELTGTIRAVNAETRDRLQQEVERIVKTQADAYHLQAEINLAAGTPPIVNPPEPVSWVRQAVATLLGEAALVPLGYANMGGEDFAVYMEKIPGCFIRVGAREPGGTVIPAHSPGFYAAEESIFVGSAVLAQAARVALHALHQA
ncbi:MAG: M20 family metallopeptidase [bacterium]